jgi:hypothetical protein
MAQQSDTLDFSQPENEMSRIADVERRKLFARNDFSDNANEYSPVNPAAIANGDEIGRGTGGDLDIYNYNAGTKTDQIERKSDIVVNKYNPDKPYFSVTQ